MNNTNAPGRINGFDALRTIAMWLGIVLHAIIVYKVIPEPNWPHDPGLNSSFLDWLYYLIHSFRMPLFFLVAGFFARMVIVRSGINYFAKQRLKRILVPFVLGVIIIVPLSLFPFSFYQFHYVQGQPAREAMQNSARQMFGWNGLAHLWFLYYLLIFYVISVTAIFLLPLKNLTAGLSRLFANVSLLKLLAAAGLLWLVFLVNKTASPEVYTGIKPKLSYIFYYGFFYACGWLLQTNMESVSSMKKNAWFLFLLGLALSVFQFYKGTTMNFSLAIPYAITSIQIISLIAGLTGLFVKYFNRESKLWRYCSDAAYWVYLVHLSIVAFFQVLLIGSSVPLLLRLVIVLLASFTLSLLSYHYLVRFTIIGEFLHGKRTRNGKDLKPSPVPEKL